MGCYVKVDKLEVLRSVLSIAWGRCDMNIIYI